MLCIQVEDSLQTVVAAGKFTKILDEKKITSDVCHAYVSNACLHLVRTRPFGEIIRLSGSFPCYIALYSNRRCATSTNRCITDNASWNKIHDRTLHEDDHG